MQKIRDWGFPVALIVSWIVAAAYTLSLMIEAPHVRAPDKGPAPEATAAAPAS